MQEKKAKLQNKINGIEKEQENQQSSYEVSKNYLQSMCEQCGVLLGAISKTRHVILDFDMVSEIITFIGLQICADAYF